MQTTNSGLIAIDREAKVFAYTYHFSAEATSTMFVAPMADGRLMVVSPSTTLPDAVADELSRYGHIGALVANNGFHHMGHKTWRTRYPDAKSYAPVDAIRRIAKKNRDNIDFEPISKLAPLLGEGVGFRDVPDSKCGETWFWARVDGGYAWYASDVLANMSSIPGNFVFRALFKLTGSAPGYRIFKLALKFMVKKPKAALKLMLDDLEAHPPTVMVPAHGEILEGGDLAERTRALLRSAI